MYYSTVSLPWTLAQVGTRKILSSCLSKLSCLFYLQHLCLEGPLVQEAVSSSHSWSPGSAGCDLRSCAGCLTWEHRTPSEDIMGTEQTQPYKLIITTFYFLNLLLPLRPSIKTTYQFTSEVRIIYYTQFYCFESLLNTLELEKWVTLYHLILNDESHLCEKFFTGTENKMLILPIENYWYLSIQKTKTK